ncbi:hypothetical protein [Streptomyces sp. NBC_00443]|uniref:hypothetical protein n=1 Tax=Streptomyces sp. NBC_00443 TaxID=2975743 RepID=UPI002E1E4A8B
MQVPPASEALVNIPAYGSTDNCITAEGASGSHVEAIQKALGLEDDGVYGPKTRDKLKWRSTTGHCGTLP